MSSPLPSSTERHFRLLQAVAGHLAVEAPLQQLLPAIAQALQQAWQCDYVGCAVVDASAGLLRFCAHAGPAAQRLAVGLRQPLSHGIVGRVARHGAAVCAEEVARHPDYLAVLPEIRSEVCVPVLDQGEVVLLIDAQSSQPAAFAADDLAALGLLAEWLGGRHAAQRQLVAARERAEVIELLAGVSRAMLAEDALDGMLQRLVDELQRGFRLTLATLCLIDPDSGELRLRASAGSSRFLLVPGQRWVDGHGITGRAIRSGKRVFVPDVRRDPDYVEGHPETCAELVVPIRFRGDVLGFINLESAQAATFSPANQTAVQALADQASGAIRLAMARDHLERANRQVSETARALERSHRRIARANRWLREMSLRDALTGLGNRRRLDRALRFAAKSAAVAEQPWSVLLLDIDHYKTFNDLYGHAQGDQCLRRIGRAVRNATRGWSAVATRYGGEEFAIVVEQADRAAALACAQQIQQAIAELAIVHAGSPAWGVVTVSLGVASSTPDQRMSGEALLAQADVALYAAKRDGRNRIVVA